MNEIKSSLIEVRKAYRLIYDFQKKILDLVEFIGAEYGRPYSGGYSKFCNVTPRNGKGSLNNWAWDWLNMYFYEFTFHDELNKGFFSIFLISDTGFYQAKNEDPYFDNKLEIGKFKNPELSSTKLAFFYGDKIWEFDGFIKNGWEDLDFILAKEGVFTKEDNSGKMIFKNYSLEDFSSYEKALIKLRDFSDFCVKNGIPLYLKRDQEIE